MRDRYRGAASVVAEPVFRCADEDRNRIKNTADEVPMAELGFAEQLMEDLPPADVRHVLDVFATDLVRLHGALCGQAAGHDQAGFCRTAHALAGAAGAVGAAGLESVCRAVMRPPAGVTLDLAASLEAIATEAMAAEAELQAVLRHLETGDA